jgi:hypothetical protein
MADVAAASPPPQSPIADGAGRDALSAAQRGDLAALRRALAANKASALEARYESGDAAAAPVMWSCAIDRASGSFTPASDVFMFGLCMWEALARGAPLFGDAAMPRAKIAQRLNSGQRPAALPEGLCPEGVRKLIVRCLDADAARRPSMEEVAETLKEEYVRGRARAKYAASWERLAGSVATKEDVLFAVKRLQQRADDLA